MEKKIIHLEVPAIGQGYDIYIPVFITVAELTELLVRAVREVSGGYDTSSNEALCLKEREILMEPGKTVSDYNIQNGDHLVMI